MQECVSDVESWMTLNRLQLNERKMEAMLVMSKRAPTSGRIPQSSAWEILTLIFSDLVKTLGVTLDSSLSMHQQVTNTCTAAYIELRRISPICQYLTVDATKTLISAFVLSRLDYCNALLSGVPQYLLDRLKSPKCSCKTHSQSFQIRPCYSHSALTPLAASRS